MGIAAVHLFHCGERSLSNCFFSRQLQCHRKGEDDGFIEDLVSHCDITSFSGIVGERNGNTFLVLCSSPFKASETIAVLQLEDSSFSTVSSAFDFAFDLLAFLSSVPKALPLPLQSLQSIHSFVSRHIRFGRYVPLVQYSLVDSIPKEIVFSFSEFQIYSGNEKLKSVTGAIAVENAIGSLDLEIISEIDLNSIVLTHPGYSLQKGRLLTLKVPVYQASQEILRFPLQRDPVNVRVDASAVISKRTVVLTVSIRSQSTVIDMADISFHLRGIPTVTTLTPEETSKGTFSVLGKTFKWTHSSFRSAKGTVLLTVPNISSNPPEWVLDASFEFSSSPMPEMSITKCSFRGSERNFQQTTKVKKTLNIQVERTFKPMRSL